MVMRTSPASGQNDAHCWNDSGESPERTSAWPPATNRSQAACEIASSPPTEPVASVVDEPGTNERSVAPTASARHEKRRSARSISYTGS
jgi:hypothetical protein